MILLQEPGADEERDTWEGEQKCPLNDFYGSLHNGEVLCVSNWTEILSPQIDEETEINFPEIEQVIFR